MIPQIPEINPVQLLYNPYNPITRYELAEILGVSDCTVKSWIERKRNPAKPVQKLAALILEQWQTSK
jgi:DNA-binding transcriptional regulator YiaG